MSGRVLDIHFHTGLFAGDFDCYRAGLFDFCCVEFPPCNAAIPSLTAGLWGLAALGAALLGETLLLLAS